MWKPLPPFGIMSNTKKNYIGYNFKIKIRYQSSYVIERRFKPLKHRQRHSKRSHWNPDFINRVIKTQKQISRNM